ncbi:MAG: carbohydrate ABC transporter permease [Clostridiales bacterium]|jgi:putative aldouronate transport system permease protein|nr:carbohydrate ABC transporter permease [Clostridiales bacterium]
MQASSKAVKSPPNVSSSVGKLRKNNWFDYLNLTVMLLFSIAILYPFYNSILVSFTPESVYIKTPFMFLPKALTLDSYYIVFQSKVIFTGFGVTTLITVVGVAYNMLLTVLMAYCFNREFPGKKVILYLILFTMFFSGGLIPYYLLVKDLHLMNSIFSMILPTGVSITYMTVMRQYFAALPEELQESARLDGASEFVILFLIILPLALPIVVTFALYYGIERWNEWWNGMLFIKDAFKQPLQLVLRGIIQSATSEAMSSNLQEAGIVPFSDGVKMASVVVTMTPIMCVYPFLQKYFVQGLAIGAVKG